MLWFFGIRVLGSGLASRGSSSRPTQAEFAKASSARSSRGASSCNRDPTTPRSALKSKAASDAVLPTVKKVLSWKDPERVTEYSEASLSTPSTPDDREARGAARDAASDEVAAKSGSSSESSTMSVELSGEEADVLLAELLAACAEDEALASAALAVSLHTARGRRPCGC